MVFTPPAYCGMTLDRNSTLREDAAWIDRQLNAECARILPLWRDRNLFQSNQRGTPTACFVERQRADAVLGDAAQLVYLGHDHDHDRAAPIFAADLTHLEEAHATGLISVPGFDLRFLDLRAVGPTLAGAEAATLACARGLIYWHRQNQHCGRCGSATLSHRGGHLRRCVNAQCARESFPRIDPAVIMLVAQLEPEDGVPKCLLGRGRGLPKRVYSTLAGYVDSGESLEAAVAREVMEEAGIAVCQITYFASQPWPFPASMMVGFNARTRDRHLTIAADELEDARWFSAAELRQFGEYDDPKSDFALPRRDSIARTLIEAWLAQIPG